MDPELFFPNDGSGVEVARKICMRCPVRDNCLEYAIAERIPYGVWGGASERERVRIRRRRAAQKAAQKTARAGWDH